MFNLPVNESREYEKYLEKFKKLSDEHKSFMAGDSLSSNFVFDCEDLKENFQTFGNSHSRIKNKLMIIFLNCLNLFLMLKNNNLKLLICLLAKIYVTFHIIGLNTNSIPLKSLLNVTLIHTYTTVVRVLELSL
jgi:hypothetical protein